MKQGSGNNLLSHSFLSVDDVDAVFQPLISTSCACTVHSVGDVVIGAIGLHAVYCRAAVLHLHAASL